MRDIYPWTTCRTTPPACFLSRRSDAPRDEHRSYWYSSTYVSTRTALRRGRSPPKSKQARAWRGGWKKQRHLGREGRERLLLLSRCPQDSGPNARDRSNCTCTCKPSSPGCRSATETPSAHRPLSRLLMSLPVCLLFFLLPPSSFLHLPSVVSLSVFQLHEHPMKMASHSISSCTTSKGLLTPFFQCSPVRSPLVDWPGRRPFYSVHT